MNKCFCLASVLRVPLNNCPREIVRRDFYLEHLLAAFSFGVRTGLLVWARMAALITRLTQTMFHGTRCRMQVYVDDPLVLMRGALSQVENMCNKFLAFWTTVVLKNSWNKGTLGHAVCWIGAQTCLDNSSKEM